MSTLIQKNGTLYLMNQNGESEKNYNDKLKFIFTNISNERGDFETRCNIEKCYQNYKRLGVVYNKDIMDIIQK